MSDWMLAICITIGTIGIFGIFPFIVKYVLDPYCKWASNIVDGNRDNDR